ncbi:MAG: aminoacyl-tRNA hydrolase [Candidatus Onthomorpha sp.]|nr:aminoacyl-tRNA hydrolase [Bacteroidales bacterium]MDY4861123.1 aminoacyl-tRNA hydrolase [Candidatus Onthomorpha sp.]MCI6801344.1 aminoacyl-tRNA hydrolase [Bacteroidales bacterium]MCI6900692.1 aminoacyl-tRNA hydrolase [Bacteroidales bacterium]MCI6963033.1 aminoacyl-tRNA hydrolase [Bacteroidales bacterium]
MKYLIVGLGNPGEEYEQTRHNIGYMALDRFVKTINEENPANSCSFSIDRHAYVAQTKVKGRSLVLVKPTTFMNLSGKAVKYWLDKEKIPVENMLIIVDDLALDLGAIRLRMGGSDGGHNGLKDIIASLGHNKFNRLRFGIGNNFARGRQIDFVLGKIEGEDWNVVDEKLNTCCDIIKSFVTIGMDRTMNLFNRK